MARPTKQLVERMFTDTGANVQLVRQHLDLGNKEVEAAWAELETLIAVALRIMEKTNPSKIDSVVRTVAISAAMSGKPFMD